MTMVADSVFSLRSSLAILLMSAIMVLCGFSLSTVSAQDKSNLCQGANLTFQDKVNGQNINCGRDAEGNKVNNKASLNNLVGLIVNILSIIVGIVAVIMIIWGGLKFMTSAGDSSKITSARNTIIYAIIGLIIVALAQFIVKFVLNKAASTSGS